MRVDLATMPRGAITRFAPSPTGTLHLGHVANAIWTWGLAQAVGGEVVVRIEDHDRGRCRPAFERAILDDLDWLGLGRDTASRGSLEGPGSSFRQSDNDARYLDALRRLQATAHVYACRCSRRQIAEREGDAPPGTERRYPGICRALGVALGSGVGIRVVLPDEVIPFNDARVGNQTQRPANQCGDLLLKDATGNWTYHFSVVVDDIVQGVDLVVRGEDLLPSTGRQILLARMLGRETPPRFCHHPLIVAPTGAKLSKRDGAPGIDQLRLGGHSPQWVLGMAAHATGLLSEPHDLEPDRLGDLFR